MSQAKDTLLRLFALLRLIPTEPQRIATPTLLDKLRDRGFSVTLRSVQRDLNRLSTPFSLQCVDSEIPFRWSFTPDAPLKLEDMDASTALALYLSESHLNTVLPQTVLNQLAPQFRRARNFLGKLGHNGLADWARRVRAIPNGKTLLPAAVNTVAISYLLASVDGYGILRQFALHRIQQIQILDEPSVLHDIFDVDDYIDSGIFSQRENNLSVELVVDVHPQIAVLLSETPLRHEQTLSDIPSHTWKRLRAQVPLDRETLWWIFGLNDNIRVYGPQVWVDEISDRLNSMQNLYTSTDRDMSCRIAVENYG